MAKNINFKRVATLLDHLYCGPDKNSNTITLWQKTFKGVLNAQEARRLFEAFAGDAGYLLARSPRMMVWSKSANPQNWTEKWVENFFSDNAIQSSFGMKTGPDGKALWHRPSKSSTDEAAASEEDIAALAALKLKLQLSEYSDEELLAELQRRDDERKAAEERERKRRLIEEFLATWDLTIEDLLQYNQVI